MRGLIEEKFARGRGGASATIGPYVIEGDAVRHPDGSLTALFSTGELDVEGLDSARRAALVAAFSRLCNTLEMHLQLLVRVRQLTADTQVESEPSAHPRLEGAMQAFWRTHLRERAVHTRAVLVAVRATDQQALPVVVGPVCDGLRAIGVDTVRLEGDALAATVASGLPIAAPVSWTVQPRFVRIGDLFVTGFSLRRLPGNAVGAGWLAPLLRVPVECDIAIHIAPASLGDALTSLHRRLRDFSAHRMMETERGLVGDVHVDIALDSAYELRGRLARNLGRALHLSVTATVRAATQDEMLRRADIVRLGFQAALAGAEPTHFRHLAAFITTLPVGVDSLGACKLVESSAAATCMPWVEAGCSDAHGYRLGAALRSGVPVQLSPFDATQHANANIAVFATSGHGKSFAMGTLVLEAATRGVEAVIIDPEGEYAHLVTSLGGTYLALAPGTDAAVNVFDAAGDDDEAIAGVVDLVTVLCGDRLGDVERAHVDAAARTARDTAQRDQRVPLLGDCLMHLERDAPPVAVVLRRFCTGALGQLFNRPTSVRLDGGVCAVSLRDMPAEHVGAATLLVARWLWGLVRHRPGRRHIVFDEVGALCAHPPLRALLVQLARRCRKYGASLVVATQNAQDLLGSDEGSVVATNCATVLLGGHRPAETARMEQAFGLTEAQRRFLETASRGQFLLLAGDRRVAMRVLVPPEHAEILSPPPP